MPGTQKCTTNYLGGCTQEKIKQHGGKAGQFCDAAVFPTAGSVFFPDSRSLLEMEILCPSQSSRSHRGLCSHAIRAHRLTAPQGKAGYPHGDTWDFQQKQYPHLEMMCKKVTVLALSA
ncbi:hypothetical protein ACOMHN_060781 [Nucella lapillus]